MVVTSLVLRTLHPFPSLLHHSFSSYTLLSTTISLVFCGESASLPPRLQLPQQKTLENKYPFSFYLSTIANNCDRRKLRKCGNYRNYVTRLREKLLSLTVTFQQLIYLSLNKIRQNIIIHHCMSV